MRKWYEVRILICLLLAMLLCTGCQSQEPVEKETISEQESSIAVSEEETETEPQTRSDEEQLKQLYEEIEGSAGCVQMPILCELGEIMAMECRNNELLLIRRKDSSNAEIEIWNLETGNILKNTSLETKEYDFLEGSFLEDGSVWVYSQEQCILWIFDADLQRKETVSLPADEYNIVYGDAEYDRLWQRQMGNTLLCYDISEKEEMQMQLEKLIGITDEDAWCSLEAVRNGKAYLQTYWTDGREPACFEIDPKQKTAKVRMLASVPSGALQCSGGFVWSNGLICTIVDYRRPCELRNLEELPRKAEPVFYEDSFLFLELKGNLCIYDCMKGRMYQAFPFDSCQETVEQMTWNEAKNQIIFKVCSEQEERICIQDLDAEFDENACIRTVCRETQIQRRIKQIKARIEKYGFNLLTNKEVEKVPDDSGYVLRPIKDLMTRYQMYFLFLKFIQNLPDGLTEELAQAHGEDIEVYFCSQIRNGDAEGNLDSAGAYVTQYFVEEGDEWEMRTRLVLDISSMAVQEQNLAHEFLHLLEEGFWNDADSEILETWYSDWLCLSPEDAYTYGYDNYQYGNDFPLVYGYAQSKEETYFLDEYASTYPNEDRARVFEYLYITGNELEDVDYFEYPRIRKKGIYLCKLLRAAYPSVNQSAQNVWEMGFTPQEMQEIREAVRVD